MCSLDESKESGNKYHTLSDLANYAMILKVYIENKK